MNILILGASGYLGTNSINYFIGQKNYNIHAHVIDKECKVSNDKLTFCNFNLLDSKEIVNYTKKNNISVVINYVYVENMEISKKIIESLKEIPNDIKIIHISSSVVYGNVKGKAKETDKLNGNSQYAKIKIQEEKLLADRDNCLILRLFNPLNYVEEYVIPNTRSKQLFEIIKQNKTIILYVNENDEFIKKDYIEIIDYFVYLDALITNNAKGVYNIGSGVTKSIYELYKTYSSKSSKMVKEIHEIDIINSCANVDKLNSEINTNFSVGITTYKRPDNIKRILEEYDSYNLKFKVYINDDSEDDILKKYLNEKIFENIIVKYQLNIKSLGHDLNIKNLFSRVEEKYLSFCSDSSFLNKKAIEYYILKSQGDYAGFIHNVGKRVSKIKSKEYKKAIDAYYDLGWHITLSGSTVINIDVYKEINQEIIDKYINCDFMQLGIFLETIVNHKGSILWNNEDYINTIPKKTTSYWKKSSFSVFGKNWYVFNFKLSPFHTDKKKASKVLKDHSKYTKLFKFKDFLAFRDYYNYQNYKENKKYVDIQVGHSLNMYFLIPKKLSKLIRRYVSWRNNG